MKFDLKKIKGRKTLLRLFTLFVGQSTFIASDQEITTLLKKREYNHLNSNEI